MNRYTFTIHGICPHGGETNYYLVCVTSHEVIRAEVIAAAANDLRGAPLIQEDLGAALAEKIPGGAITMSGVHCGIKLESTH